MKKFVIFAGLAERTFDEMESHIQYLDSVINMYKDKVKDLVQSNEDLITLKQKLTDALKTESKKRQQLEEAYKEYYKAYGPLLKGAVKKKRLPRGRK